KKPSTTLPRRQNTSNRLRSMSGARRFTKRIKRTRWRPSSSRWSEVRSSRGCSNTTPIRPTTHSLRVGARWSSMSHTARHTLASRASSSSRRRSKTASRLSRRKHAPPGSPYYQINPSGRVPYLVNDSGVGMEDSQLICAYLDGLDGKPRFHNASRASDWTYLRFEFAARSMCDGIAVWGREMARPQNERSPTTLAHEAARAQRMADFFEDRTTDPLMQGPPSMAHLILAVAV